MRARAGGLLTLLALCLAAGCGGEAGVERRTVGEGAEAAVVLVPAGDGPHPVVVFLHGWRSRSTDDYEPWLEHLVEEGNAVIYPVYEPRALSFPSTWLPNALAGVRAALDEVPLRRDGVVVTGHSAGGALAADYAAAAAAAGLPPARAVFSVYPGRRLRGFPGFIPQQDPSQIPARTQVLAVAGADDRAVGDAEARALVTGATRVPRERRRFEEITDPEADDHSAPQRDDEAARRAFWKRLDELIASSGRGLKTSSSTRP